MEDSWIHKTVGEIADSVSETHVFDRENLIFLNTSDILQGRVLHKAYSPVQSFPGQAKKSIKNGDILFSEIRPANGRYAFVDFEAHDYVVSTKLMVIRARKGINPRFIYHFLVSEPITSWLQHLAESRSGTFPQITFDQVAALPIRLPPPCIQDQIVSFLDAIASKIELNRRMNETLEGMARAIFQSWFVDFDPVRAKAAGRQPFGMDASTAALFPASFVDSPLGKIPKGWRAGALGEVAENPRRGVGAAAIESCTPYIALEHMPRRCIALSEWGTADAVVSNKFEFKFGEILFGKLRPYFHKVGVAAVKGVCSTDILVIRPRNEDQFTFVLGHVSSDDFVEFTNARSTGTKMPRTNWDDMVRYPMALPPDELTKTFNELCSPMLARINAAIHESRMLAQIRDALLPKLISGEIRVKQAEKLIEAKV